MTKVTPYAISIECTNDAVQTGATNDSTMTPSEDDTLENRAAWQTMIDRYLLEWACNPSELADEGIDPPSRETLARVIRWARTWRDRACPPPTHISSDPNGGILLERREGNGREVFHFWDNEASEYLRYIDGRIVKRREF